MVIFFKEYIVLLLITGLYGLIGGFSIMPFRHLIKYPVLAAPMAGILLTSMGVFLLYSFAKFSVVTSLTLTGLIGIFFTTLSLFHLKAKYDRQVLWLIFVFLSLAAIVTLLMNFTSIQLNSTGFLFREGSDHLGYSMMADWLNTHWITQAPNVDPALPYQSFSALLSGDQHARAASERFGSFFTLAIISTLLGKSSLFAYDMTCSIILLASYLGVAALFSRSLKVLIAILLALVMGLWFVLAHTGYLGKLMGFPAAIFISGLYLLQQNSTSQNKNNLLIVSIMLLLTFAAAMSYPGQVLSLFLIALGGLFLVCRITNVIMNFNINNKIVFGENAALLLVMILIGFSASGMLAVPSHIGLARGLFPLDWLTIFLNQFDVRYLAHDVVFNFYSKNISIFFLISAISIMVVVFFIALKKRNIIAVSLMGAAMIFLWIPYLLDEKWFSYELSGALFPLFICGLAWMIDDIPLISKKNKIMFSFLFCLMGVAIVIRIPLFAESVHRYVLFGTPAAMQYSQKEFDKLVEVIGDHSVIIDIPNVMFALPVLTEFGRQDMNLQWTPQSWEAILSYRHWQPPKLLPSRLVLGLTADSLAILGLKPVRPDACDVIAKTRQYQLFSCQHLIKATQVPLTYQA